MTPLRHAQQPLGADWLIDAFDADKLNFSESRRALDQPRRGRAEQHATRRCHRFHPLSHPHLLTNGGVTERPRTDLTGDHLTGVKSHAQLEVDTVALSNVDAKSLRLLLNTQGRQAGTDCVILQRHRRTEHRHDPVTGELVHRTAVSLHHRRAAVGEVGHDLAQPLGPHRRSDVHRMHHVGEEDRDLLVLRRCGRRRDWRTTLATELGLRAQLCPARPARQAGCGHVVAVNIVLLPS